MRARPSLYTTELVAARQQAFSEGLFVAPKGSTKIECSACRDRGLMGGSWMDKHMRGHSPCPDCGKVKPTSTLALHRAKAH